MEFDLIEADNSNFSYGRTQSVQYVVIHYTGNDGDNARNNCKYFQGKNRNASANLFVDNKEILLSVKDTNTAWSVGARQYKHPYARNCNTFNIEMCDVIKNGKFDIDDDTYRNTVIAAAYYMKKFGLGMDRLLRHYDVTGKLCPIEFIDDKTWQKFKDDVKKEMEGKKMKIKKKLVVKGKEKEVEIICEQGKWYVPLSEVGRYEKGKGIIE